MTTAPARTRVLQIASPRPRPPPVTRATLSSSVDDMTGLLGNSGIETRIARECRHRRPWEQATGRPAVERSVGARACPADPAAVEDVLVHFSDRLRNPAPGE